MVDVYRPPKGEAIRKQIDAALVAARARRNGGRGGIRTHGGLPHARFRVECLKPDSATLPLRKRTSNPPTPKASAWQTLNVQHQTSNASITQISVCGGRLCLGANSTSWTLRGEFLHEPCQPWQTGLFASRSKKMLQFSSCHVWQVYCILCVHTDSHAITCC
jgi:hypothetical protein